MNKHKEIRCPRCNARIIDADWSTLTELVPIVDGDGIIMDFYLKCPKCKTQIGMNKK